MDITQIFAQILGAVGVLIFVILYHGKNIRNVLKKKFLMDIVWALHYFLVGGYTGCMTNLICCVREVVFMNNDKKIFKSRIWLLVFIILNWVFTIATWTGGYCTLPALVATLATYSFWQKSITIAQIIVLVNNVFMIVYDIFVSSYMGIVGETLAFISVILALVMSKRNAVN